MGILTGVILLVIGLIACFFGKRFYRIVLALAGFSIGFYSVSGALATQSDTIQLIGAIAAGLVVGFLFWMAYKFAYVLFGAFVGLVLGTLIAVAFNLSGIVAVIVVIVGLILGAIAGSRLANVIIEFSTAFGGASQAIAGIAALATAMNIALPLADPTHGGANTESTAGIITLVAVIVLGFIGFMFQRGTIATPE